jgi:hypothetical protein
MHYTTHEHLQSRSHTFALCFHAACTDFTFAHAQHCSLLDFDWSDGDVVFANSTCFDDALMAAVAAKAQRLRPGALLITFTRGLDSAAFEVCTYRYVVCEFEVHAHICKYTCFYMDITIT